MVPSRTYGAERGLQLDSNLFSTLVHERDVPIVHLPMQHIGNVRVHEHVFEELVDMSRIKPSDAFVSDGAFMTNDDIAKGVGIDSHHTFDIVSLDR